MKKLIKILSLIIAITVIFSCVSVSAFALENSKNYYYFDAINDDGVKIDDGITTDFFGNEIVINNIGCYGGTGTDAEYIPESDESVMLRAIMSLIQGIINALIN